MSQRQAVIKLLPKKDIGNRFLENWRPISLLNVDYKIITKALAEKLETVLLSIILSRQTACVKNMFIGEPGRVISDIIEMTDLFSKESFLVAIDIEKAFDSLGHSFLIDVLKKFGFSSNFTNRIETLIAKPQSKYFGPRQAYSDLCSSFHFMPLLLFFQKLRKKQKYRRSGNIRK